MPSSEPLGTSNIASPEPNLRRRARLWSDAPRAAYVHVPFCAHRCGYCNFTLVAGRDDLVEPYLRSIEREMAAFKTPREVDTLFLGGGTPTQLRGADLSRLLQTALRWFPLAQGYEFSVEANPADVTAEMVSIFAQHGVNRVSLGAQSFDAAKLRALERDHSAADIERAVEICRPYIRSISVDLIFGAPGETLRGWQADVQSALRLRPDHVSTYGLTFERGTTFWGRLVKGHLARVDEQIDRGMYELAIDALDAAGLEHYEVSNFARRRHRCRHNEVYWSGEGYYAVGPGAARYISGRREMNHRSTTMYLRRVLAGQSPITESESLSPEDRAREALVFGLRRIEGVEPAGFRERFGFEVDAIVGTELADMIARGLIEQADERIRLTREGLMLSDSIWPYFLKK